MPARSRAAKAAGSIAAGAAGSGAGRAAGPLVDPVGPRVVPGDTNAAGGACPSGAARDWAQTGRVASRGMAAPTSSTWRAAGKRLATEGASVKENGRVMAANGARTNLSGPPQPSPLPPCCLRLRLIPIPRSLVPGGFWWWVAAAARMPWAGPWPVVPGSSGCGWLRAMGARPASRAACNWRLPKAMGRPSMRPPTTTRSTWWWWVLRPPWRPAWPTVCGRRAWRFSVPEPTAPCWRPARPGPSN